MNINKYINWNDIWDSEICLDSNIENLEDENKELFDILNQFKKDTEVSLDFDECEINNGDLVFVFSETGGQSEGDSQGWSRVYYIVVDSEDFLIKDASYEQG